MTKKRVAIIFIVVLLGLFVMVMTFDKLKEENVEIPSRCSTLYLETAELMSSGIRENVAAYIQEKSEVFGLSAEGGEQTKYTDDTGNIKFIEQIFFGETGKSETEYYYSDGSVFFISKSNFEYEKPISVDSSANVNRIDIKKFILDENYQICEWYLNNELQTNSLDTQELVNFLLNLLNKNE